MTVEFCEHPFYLVQNEILWRDIFVFIKEYRIPFNFRQFETNLIRINQDFE